MRFRIIGLFAGAILLFVGVLMLNPEFRMIMNEVNIELMEQAEEQGLLEAELPMGAKNVVDNGCEVEGVLAGEIRFELRGVDWTYRCAAINTEGETVPDISGVEGDFKTLETQVQQCSAVVSVSDEGVGKIVWYDAALGVAYSLSMAESANGDTLQSIANLMYTSMQGDA